ncbi:TPA: 23S rRNA pseudouridine synthase F [Candidatus Uhrbacteria bacterium]|nr:23S rRNA pseudouridine synthase F [Candidatus Uhrbacteria bacterium]
MRLNKFLVSVGACSRREADRLIEDERVSVNRTPALLGQKVTGKEIITIDGEPVGKPPTKRIYMAYHKPIGIICTSDPNAEDNIIEAINFPERIFHIGRLDVASSGLILLTNDGDIVNHILRAEEQHEKEYVIQTDRPLTDIFLHRMETGVVIDDRHTLPATVKRLGPDRFTLTLIEGRNRQIRKMCEALGYEVKQLKRIRVMNIQLGDLPPGRWRFLTPQEEKELLENKK